MEQLEVQALLALQSGEAPAASCSQRAVEAVGVLWSVLKTMPSREMAAEDITGFAAGVGFTPKRKMPALPPVGVYLIGSLAMGTAAAVGPEVVADVAMEMPSTCFEGKDHLNHRYHVKRALYLMAVAAHLKSRGIKRLSWSLVNHDARRPALMADIKLPNGSITARLLPFPADGALDVRKLRPDRNSLRAVCSSSVSEGPQQLPTPHYNTSVLQDVFLRSAEQKWQTAVHTVPALPSHVRLLREWARHRTLEQQPNGLTGFFWSMFAVYLVQKGILVVSMNPVQGFQAALRALANPNMFAGGMQLATDSDSSMPKPPSKALFQQHFDVVFLGSHGWENFAAHISGSQVAEAQHAARLSVEGLSKATINDAATDIVSPVGCTFDSTFDYQYAVSVPNHQGNSLSTADELPWRSLERNIEDIVRQAAGTRALQVHVQRRSVQSMHPKTGISQVDTQRVRLGVRVDVAHVHRAVDMGPAADDADAVKAFRTLWGAKSELRRFPDGKIAEAVVWDVPAGERHLILDHLVSFVLTRHLPAGSSVQSFAGTFDSVAVAPGMRLAHAAAAARALDAATDKLRKQLLSVNGLPLKVVMVQLLSTVSRRTTPLLPHPSWLAGSGLNESSGSPLYSRTLQAVEVLATLEGSGKWPSTSAALRKVKAALGIQLALALEKGHGLKCRASEEVLDVLFDGFAFRIHLHCSRDAVTSASLGNSWGSDADLRLRSAHHDLIQTTKVTAPVLAPVAQVAQRWVALHMCSSYFSPEAVELCVAAAVSKTSNWSSAGSTWVGFLRFLLLISTHDWARRPLVIANDSELGSASLRHLHTLYEEARRRNAQPAMCIIAPFQMDLSFGQRHCPSKPLLHRLVILAQRALEDILAWAASERQESNSSAAPMPGFRASLAACDALLVLREEAMAMDGRVLPMALLPGHSLCTASVPLMSAKSRSILRAPAGTLLRSSGKELQNQVLVDFNPVQNYMRELQDRFSSIAMFFFDRYDGRVIGVKWRSAAPSDIFAAKVDDAHSLCIHRRQAVTGGIDLDQSAALADMACLGAGLVADVRVLRTS